MIISCWEGSFCLTILAVLIHLKQGQLRIVRKKRQRQGKRRRRGRNGTTLSFTATHLNLKGTWESSLRALSFYSSARLGTQSFTYRFWGHSRSRVLPSFAETKRGVYKNTFNNWVKTRSLVMGSFWCPLDWRFNSVDLLFILFYGQRGRHPYKQGLTFLVWIYHCFEHNLWVPLLYP